MKKIMNDWIEKIKILKDNARNMTVSHKRMEDLKVACILDEFSYVCLKYECRLIPLDVDHWHETLVNEEPDLLLVESAWLGYLNKWKHKIAGRSKMKNTLKENLIKQCNKMHIPTIFWNKEDPICFEHFIEAARLFDYIFTTDEGSVEKYKRILGHNKVYVLPFAAQPKFHNPINRDRKILGKVAFAGTWYKMYLNRKKDMEMILRPAMKYDLHIYDRMHGNRIGNRYGFPKIYKYYIKGTIPYEKMPELYKGYDIFLNVNSVQDSPTMFSRRVFELLACGTNVISSYALGIDRIFPGIVKLCKSQEDVVKYLELLLRDRQLRDRLSLLGQRKVFLQHTYGHRIETILEKIDIKYRTKEMPGVTIITCTNPHDSMENVLDNFQRQSYQKKELIIVANDHSMDIEKWEKEIKGNNSIKILGTHGPISLGECLNFAIEQANFGYVSYFSGDSYYAPEYISDLMNAFKYSDADVVGKCTYYDFIKESTTLAIMSPSMENRYVNSLWESAFIAKKNIYKQLKFPNTDIQTVTRFFKSCFNKGIKLYSTDRFNFVHINHSPSNNDSLSKCEIIGEIDDYLTYITV